MRPRVLLSSAGALALVAATMLGASASGDSGHHGRHGHHDQRTDLLRAPVAGSLTTDSPVFDVPPGGAPWVVDRASVRVKDDGRITLRLRGLVIPGVGVGPVTTVSASVACGGEIADTTKSVPLAADGDARLHDRLVLPERCIAPVVMVHPNGNTGAFIAISGRE